MNTKRVWESDLGEGFFRNPVLFTDYSDPDVIRVGDTFYMTASSFSFIPGLPILTSKDLINWDLVNYALKDGIPWEGYEKPRHDCGIWAPSIRYHAGKFWIFVGMPDEGIFVTSTEDPLGEWGPLTCIWEGKGYIDPCPVWTEDGRAFVVHAYAKSRIGFKSRLGVFEMTLDCTKAIGDDVIVFDGEKVEPKQFTIEGPKVYLRDGMIYVLSPAGGVVPGWQVALRAKDIYGPYDFQIVMHQGNARVNGPHQGGLVDTPDGKEEWFMHFQDRGVYGRICHLQKVEWKEGWPVMGVFAEDFCGEPSYVYKKPSGCPKVTPHEPNVSDDFEHGMGLQWQWMANNQGYADVVEKENGSHVLRLYAANPSGQKNPQIWDCGNVMTQKLPCPAFTMTAKMDITGLPVGAKAGTVMLGGEYAYMSLCREENQVRLDYVVSEKYNKQQTETVIFSKRFNGNEKEVIFTQTFFGDGSSTMAVKGCSDAPIYRPGKAQWTGAKIGFFAVNSEVMEPQDYKNHGFVELEYVDIKVNTEDFRGDDATPGIFLSALEGNLETVKQMTEYSKYSLNLRDAEGRGILHYAAMSGNVELVKYLVEEVGMSMVEGDRNRVTPYELAYQTMKERGIVSDFQKELCGPEKNPRIQLIWTDSLNNEPKTTRRREEVKAGKVAVYEYFEKMVGAPYETMYHNPIRTGAFPDPSVVRVGDDYYMVNSSFTYFPCVPISHSKDLIHWEIIGHAITNPEWAMLDGLESGRGYWAPDISYDGKKFYIAVTYRMNDTDYVCRKQVIVSAEKPEGPYSKPAIIDEDGIDPSIFHDEDGRKYMLLNRGARIMELNADATEMIGKPRMLWYGDMKRNPEGPHLLKKDGWYYLILAEGGTGIGHRVSIGRSKNMYGPYESCPYNPVMTQRDPMAAIQRAGHGKMLQLPDGSWYMVYLCGRLLNDKYTVLGRETALDPVVWTPDGWPLVNGGKGPSVLQKRPNLPVCECQPDMSIDGKYWMWSKTPIEGGTEFLEKDGKKVLKLYGGAPLYEVAGSQVYVTRQTDFSFTIEAAVDAALYQTGDKAGLTCYYDENTYLTFGLEKTHRGLMLAVTERIGDCLTTPFLVPAEERIYTLRIVTDGLRRSFLYVDENGKEVTLGTLGNVNYICDEGWHIGKRFTGAMAGFFVEGDSKQKRTFAEFSDVKIW